MNTVADWIAWLGDADARTVLGVSVLVAARVGPLTVLAPWIALRSAPAIVRAALVFAMTVTLAPLALEGPPVVAKGGDWAVLLLRETLVGTLFAFAAALPFYALDWAGRVTDVWRGASLSEVIAPPTGERSSPMGELYLFAGIVLFLTIGGHRFALDAFADSLVVAPLGQVAIAQTVPSAALGAARLAGSALAFSAALAAPAAACIVIVEIGLGLIARAAPQVPVFFAGMPLRAATGIAAAAIGLAVVLDQLPGAFSDGIENARALIRVLAG